MVAATTRAFELELFVVVVDDDEEEAGWMWQLLGRLLPPLLPLVLTTTPLSVSLRIDN
jgi:hypothetical protein